MTQPIDLRALDLFALCRKGESLAGDVAVRDLPRILA
ncbi:metal-binding protein, partial [Pseudomonas sp. GW460-13]